MQIENRKDGLKRLPWFVYALVAIVVILAGVFFVPRLAPQARPRSTEAGIVPNHGTAHSAMGAISTSFSVTVSGVDRSVAPPGAPASAGGRRYVMMQVAFQNDSPAQQRADPHDFRLRDESGETPPAFLPGSACKEWGMADLVPAGGQAQPLRDPDAQRAGASFGPVSLCFPATGSPGGALTLIWDPDVSMPLLDSPTEIPLR